MNRSVFTSRNPLDPWGLNRPPQRPAWLTDRVVPSYSVDRERIDVRMSVASNHHARTLRPSLVVAEALVDRHGPSQIVARARRHGFSNCLTNAVVAACCRTATDQRSHPTRSATTPAVTPPAPSAQT
jgi:hypothetical protein